MKNTLVQAILSYLRFFAKKALALNKPAVIGITGSLGKSSTREILYAILKDHFKTKVVAENSEIGLPLGILGLKPRSLGFQTLLQSILDWIRIILLTPLSTGSLKGIQYLIVEMGIDEPTPPKNMEYLLTIVKPDIAILLNAAPVHTMQFEKTIPQGTEFKNDEEKINYLVGKVAEEKAKIITQSGCKTGIYNADNEFIAKTIKQCNNVTIQKFGVSSKNDISYSGYKLSLNGTEFKFTLKIPKSPTTLNISIQNYLLPEEYRETIAAAVLAATNMGLTPEQIKKSLEDNFSLPKSRATVLNGIHNSLIIDSSYNASGIAVNGLLQVLSKLKTTTKRPIAFLLGDMRELGAEAKIEHEKVLKNMIGLVDNLYCVGPLTREYILSAIDTATDKFTNVRWFDTSSHAGEYLQKYLPEHSILLVKGSQNTIFLEEAIKYILADKNDEKLLCRQESYWLKKKNLKMS